MKGWAIMVGQLKAKNMMYTQQVEHSEFEDIDILEKYLVTAVKPDRYAIILHDKDIGAEGDLLAPHFHVMLQFENARSLKNIAKLLKVEPQYIEKWDGSTYNGYSYLIHATEKAIADGKHQYGIDEVKANFDFEELIKKASKDAKISRKQREEHLLDALLDGKISKEALERQLSGSAYARLRPKIEIVYQKYMERRAEEWRQKKRAENSKIEVIWICGQPGAGKTRLARDYAKQKSDNYFISGSGRDPFQKYNGEAVIVLDELRPTVFNYDDLLKMFDPFNEDVMGASRYYDKALTADTIIITSPYDPKKFYDEQYRDSFVDKSTDTFEQLSRRLATVICVRKDSIYEITYFPESNTYGWNKNGKKKENIYSKKREEYGEVEVQTDSSVFDVVTDQMQTIEHNNEDWELPF